MKTFIICLTVVIVSIIIAIAAYQIKKPFPTDSFAQQLREAQTVSVQFELIKIKKLELEDKNGPSNK